MKQYLSVIVVHAKDAVLRPVEYSIEKKGETIVPSEKRVEEIPDNFLRFLKGQENGNSLPRTK